MSDKQKVFAKGVYYDAPRQGAPSFVLGRIAFKVIDVIAFLQENVNEKGYVNCDIKQGKDKPYVELNNFVPSQTVQNKIAEHVPVVQIDESQIPF